MSNFTEFCHKCGGEVELAYKGFVIHKCPDCKGDLKPCSICDAYTDRQFKVYAPSCSQCPFEDSYKRTKRISFERANLLKIQKKGGLNAL